ncbi:MAG: pilus assembly protein PilP [Deltaproteobacteria bacterium]|nr:pilus assembly protein PilP [Deltaproteobacteria bacterium]
MNSKTNAALLIGTALLLTRCDEPPAPALPPPEPELEAPSFEEYPTEDPLEVRVYEPIGKRDPFRSIFETVRTEPENVAVLQRFELDQLRLTAVVSGIAQPYAMVEDPDGLGHTVTRGVLIGKNWGRVQSIYESCVTVKEEYRDYTGRKVENKVELCLPEPVVN